MCFLKVKAVGRMHMALQERNPAALPAKAGPGHSPLRAAHVGARRAAAGMAASAGKPHTFKALSEVEKTKMHLRFAENQLRPLPTAPAGPSAGPGPGGKGRPGSARRCPAGPGRAPASRRERPRAAAPPRSVFARCEPGRSWEPRTGTL